jgi:hypothetical protein
MMTVFALIVSALAVLVAIALVPIAMTAMSTNVNANLFDDIIKGKRVSNRKEN